MPAPRIESFRFGHIVVDGHVHTKDVIILPDRVIGGWWRQEGHLLRPKDLEAVFQAAPQVLIVGQGTFGRMQVAPETQRALQAAGIKLMALRTKEAVEAYSAMRDNRTAAAALHLTC